ncbi:MAG: SCO family protein [Rickettsiales bacterium]|nr:SCO family protein [Rickettsiales bacterium]
MNKKSSLIVGIILVISISVATYFTFTMPQQQQTTTSTVSDASVSIGGAFELTNHQNETVSSQDFIGKYMLVYFGFTRCPDVCPTDMAVMTEALNALDQKALEKVQPIFITIDPERDTPDMVNEFVGNFHPNFVGLTGEKTVVDEVVKQYRVYTEKLESQEPAQENNYMMNHSAFIYLMDRRGNYFTHFSSQQATSTEIAQKLKSILG